MPISFGVPGFTLTKQQRIEQLIAMVGGPVKAALIAKKNRGTIDNWRKEGADPPIEALLPLCLEAGVSLDWVATGYQIRPDLAGARPPGFSDEGPASQSVPEGFVRLAPLEPDLVMQGTVAVERWAPSDVAYSIEWLSRFGLTADTARYAIAGDNGMAPTIEKGAFLVVDIRPANPRAGLYTVKVGDELVARRLHRMPDGRSELVASADAAWRFSLPVDAGANGALQLRRIVWVGQPA